MSQYQFTVTVEKLSCVRIQQIFVNLKGFKVIENLENIENCQDCS